MAGTERKGQLSLDSSTAQPEIEAAPSTLACDANTPASSVLSESRTSFCLSGILAYGGTPATSFSLASWILGGGVIAMPTAFKSSGIILASFFLVVVAILNAYTMLIMSYAVKQTGYGTFEKMARGLLGRWWDYVAGFIYWLSCFGTAIAYVGGTAKLLTPLLLESPTASAFWKSTGGIQLITSFICIGVMLPLVIPKHVNSTRYLSALGCFFVLFFTVTVMTHSIQNGLKLGIRDEIQLGRSGIPMLEGLSVFLFAFLPQMLVFDVYYELRPKPSVRKVTWASIWGIGGCTVVYFLVGFFGYMDFGDALPDSILLMYDPLRQPAMLVSYIGLLLKLSVSFALNMIPCRNFTYHCLGWELEAVPYWKHIVVVAIHTGTMLILGLFIPNINLAFGLVGSLCGGFIGFIFPALFWMYCGGWSLKTVGLWHFLATYFLLLSGVVAVVFGTAGTIYSSFAL